MGEFGERLMGVFETYLFGLLPKLCESWKTLPLGGISNSRGLELGIGSIVWRRFCFTIFSLSFEFAATTLESSADGTEIIDFNMLHLSVEFVWQLFRGVFVSAFTFNLCFRRFSNPHGLSLTSVNLGSSVGSVTLSIFVSFGNVASKAS